MSNTKTKHKQYSLITTVFNEENNIQKFLDSYKLQTKIADEYIIVDGGSTDSTASIIKNFSESNPYLNIKLIVDKTCSKKYSKGPIARGRNIAIDNAQYDYIVVTDAGCLLKENWFEELVKPFEEFEDIDVVSGWYEGIIRNDFQVVFNKYFMPSLKKINKDKFLPSSRNVAFTKSVWKKAGKYPEKTYTAEDTLFDLNLKKIGAKFYFAQNAVVNWELPKSPDEARKKLYSYYYGDGQNKLFFNKFLLRILLLIFPIRILNSRQDFLFRYSIIYISVKAYFMGLIDRVR